VPILCRILGHVPKLEFFGGPYGLTSYCRRCKQRIRD
jgi:hypothetical protein